MFDEIPCIAVLGLGEAGGEICSDLVALGVPVRAYDPVVNAPPGATNCTSESDAANGARVVLSVNAATAAMGALESGLRGVASTTIWADLNSAAPHLERALAERSARAGIRFVDVALMSQVPGHGLRTPMLVSGTGALQYAEMLAGLGANVEVLDGPAGAASERKLLRSVFFKGMAAATVEALTAARAVGLEGWMRDLIAREFVAANAAFAERLEQGSYKHARRRADEMAAATELLETLNVPTHVASAARDWMAELAAASPPVVTE